MNANNSIKRINALVNRIVTTAALEASRFAANGFSFELREETTYVLRSHTLPMHTHGKTLFHGKQANWELNLDTGSIYIGF